jgi:hypothetical protein
MHRRWLLIGGSVAVSLLAAVALVVAARARLDADLAAREAAALEELAAFAAQTEDTADDGAAPSTTAPDSPPASLAPMPADTAPALVPGELLVVQRIPGDAYGTLAVVEPDGSRRPVEGLEDERCDRVHAGGGVLVCVRSDTAFGAPAAGTATIRSLDDPTRPEIDWFPTGLPSRARVAPDGSRFAVTSFVTGHSYLAVGEFSTETVISTPRLGPGTVWGDAIEVRPDAERYRAVDGNWWGVTFVPGQPDAVYATYGSGGVAEVLRVDAATGIAEPALPLGACPSVSPDGRYVVFKRRVEGASAPRSLIVRDLRSGEEWELGETRFVDDQVEWLDDDTVLYAMNRDDATLVQPVADVWAVDVAPGAVPSVLVPFAASPARYLDTRA